MLLGSAILSGLGLFAFSRAHGSMLFAAATIFAFGVCFFWPTMLGFVNERFPRTGALGLAIMGGAGMLGTSIVLPIIGRSIDVGISARLPAGETPASLMAAPPGSGPAAIWARIQAEAGLHTLGHMVLLPLILTVVFAVMLATRKRRDFTGSLN
jgi:hypothetical protein